MSYPPLKVWIIALFIFGMILLSVIILTPIRSAYIFTKSVEYAFNQKQKDPKDIRVVFLGSSLLKQALSDELVIERINQGESSSLEILKLGINSAVLEDFLTNEYFVNKIFEYKPNYILVQESILQREKNRELPNLKRILAFDELKNIWNGTYLSFISDRMENNANPSVFTDSVTLDPVFNFDLADFDSNIQMLTEFTTRIEGTSIVIAEVPLPEKIEKTRRTILRSSNYSSIRASLEENHGIIFIDFDRPLHYKYFFDRTHMNDAGEKIYTQWLLDQIANMVSTNNSTND